MNNIVSYQFSFCCFLLIEKVEKQVNEYQFQIKNLLDEKDESKKAFLLQIDNLSLQLQNIKDENQNLTNVCSSSYLPPFFIQNSLN